MLHLYRSVKSIKGHPLLHKSVKTGWEISIYFIYFACRAGSHVDATGARCKAFLLRVEGLGTKQFFTASQSVSSLQNRLSRSAFALLRLRSFLALLPNTRRKVSLKKRINCACTSSFLYLLRCPGLLPHIEKFEASSV